MFDINKFMEIRSLLKEVLELERALEKKRERERKLWSRCYKKLTQLLLLFFNKPDGFQTSKNKLILV